MDLSGLNSEQLAAVRHDRGPALVVAGAGTGKTHVITTRIARLIQDKLASPDQILALTFTDKAAAEMLDRLDGLIGWDAYRVSVMTFHAFGSQLLQRFGHNIGRSNSAQLIPDSVKPVLLKQYLSEVKLSYYGSQDDIIDFLSSNIDYIHSLQNADISPTKYAMYVDALKADKAVHPLDWSEAEDRLKLYRLYETIKRRIGLIDYHDQLDLSLQILQQRPNITAQIRKQYPFVLVDEYQDTNSLQDALIRNIVPRSGNIFAVGDDDQAVYGFRGARLSNILDFADHFTIARPIVLTQNYRSTQQILDSAYGLIRHNDPDRLEERLGLNKRLKGQAQGPRPLFMGYRTPAEECDGVAAALQLQLSEGVSPGDMAVLATTHTALKRLAKTLRGLGVPHGLSSSIDIFEHPELIQLWYLLQWIDMDASDQTIKQLLLGPFLGWDAEQVRIVSDSAKNSVVTLDQAIVNHAVGDSHAQGVVEKLAKWRSRAHGMPVSQFAWSIVDEIKEVWIAEAANSARKVRVFEDLELWLRQMQEYENIALDQTLAGYRQMFPMPPQIEAREVIGDDNGVALLSVHASKGLEFEVVYIINNTREAWSQTAASRRDVLPPELIAEELQLPPEHERRRLMYVALTRAKRQLILTAPMLNAGEKPRKLSPFLVELFDPEELQLSQTTKIPKLSDTLIKLQHKFGPVELYDEVRRLPFETSDGWLELSVTDIDAYIRCPYEFFLERVLKISSPVGPQLQFGNILHQLFHEYYQAKTGGGEITISELYDLLDQQWTTKGYRSEEEANTDYMRAKNTVKQFYTREEQEQRIVLATEQSFKIEVAEAKLRLKGKIDASFQLEGGVELRDFKTGRQRDSEKLTKMAKDSLQLRSYALATELMTGVAPAKVVLDYVVTGVTGEVSFSPQILRNHRAKLADIANKIRARQFDPASSFGHQCVAYQYWGSGESDDE